jgi:nucleotide-binding universal stress UspA family protein
LDAASARAVRSALRYQGVVLARGSPARRILGEAQAWAADLTVIARSQQRRRTGDPYVGSETAHVLEFAEQPVLVVSPTPEPDGRRAQATGGRTTVFSLQGRPHVAVELSGAT